MQNIEDKPPSTPKRERQRVKTESLTLAGDERSNAFFGESIPSSVYCTPSRRVRQSSVTCASGQFFGEFPSLNETPAIQEGRDESTKIACGDPIKPVKEETPERAPSSTPKQTPPPQKSPGSFFSGLLQKKSANKCSK